MSDFEKVLFLGVKDLVNKVRVTLGDGLEFLLGALNLVLAGLAVLLDAVELFLGACGGSNGS